MMELDESHRAHVESGRWHHEQISHDAHVQLWQKAMRHAAWYEVMLDAAFYFALPSIQPIQAAMLLCRLNPKEETNDSAQHISTDSTSPYDYKRLVELFESMQRANNQPRTLMDWTTAAQEHHLKIHPWVLAYFTTSQSQKRRKDLAFEQSEEKQVGSPLVQQLPPRTPLMKSNRQRILMALQNAGFDPVALPPLRNGCQCPAKSLAKRTCGLPPSAFDHAWQELLTERSIVRRTEP